MSPLSNPTGTHPIVCTLTGPQVRGQKGSTMKSLNSYLMIASVLVLIGSTAHATQFCGLTGGGLCAASCRGDLARARDLIKSSNSDEVVCALALAKDRNTVNWLVDNGVNVNTQKHSTNTDSPSGRTALFRAIFENSTEIVDALIENKINSNLADYKGTTPLMYAAAAGNLEMVKKLIAAGSSVNKQDRNSKTALCYADMYFLNSNRDAIKSLLLKRGAVCDR